MSARTRSRIRHSLFGPGFRTHPGIEGGRADTPANRSTRPFTNSRFSRHRPAALRTHPAWAAQFKSQLTHIDRLAPSKIKTSGTPH